MLAEGGQEMVIAMSGKEVMRSQVLAQVIEGKLDQASAAARLGISVRQVKRLKRRVLDEGAQGLVSKKRGRPSNRRTAPALLARAVAHIGEHYADFGPTLAAEKLEERHGITLSVETVRKAMMEAGLWHPKRGAGARVHGIRERRARCGELIQIDGSPHDWFEGRAPRCCLLVFIDDATSELKALRFVDTESTLAYMAVLHDYILEHGLPAALYSDRHSIFHVAKADEKRAGAGQTQFARALEQLGIEGIQANSPQAKGRVERANQTLQDRLVKEMRLHGIDNQEAANAWLPQFIRAHNRRFAVAPAVAGDAHVRYQGSKVALRRILSVQATRRLSSSLSCQYAGQLYQVQSQDQGLGLRGAQVTILVRSDGKLEVLWRDKSLPFTSCGKPVKQTPAADSKAVNALVEFAVHRRIPKPVGHAWKQKMELQPGQSPARFPHPKENFAPVPA